ncbi:MAG: tetratricopeptide repeat protein [bacterium]|nr:tetratricopeptide repeat protein [bacterium]
MKTNQDVQVYDYVHTGVEKVSIFRTIINFILGIAIIASLIILITGVGYIEHTSSPEFLFQQGLSHIQKAEQSESPSVRQQYFQLGFDSFMKAAEQENAAAQYMVGYWLSEGGDGVDLDIPNGISWLEKSAAKDNDAAMTHLAQLYLISDGYIDYEKAYAWSLKAANLNNGRAMYFLHLLTADDTFQYYNENESLGWLKKAVDAGDPDAMFNLAVTKFEVFSSSSKTNDDNPFESMKEITTLLKKSAEKGNNKATELLKKLGQE